jgi:chloramphenicol O-acetyltransferase type A
MVAINTVEELKLRIVDGKVILFDEVHVGGTIGRPDGTFGFSFFHYSPDFKTFNAICRNRYNPFTIRQV